ncbi:MAG: hypothetical protein GY856_17135 [bacterium]|nr:hypothetical protein [bacterium]
MRRGSGPARSQSSIEVRVEVDEGEQQLREGKELDLELLGDGVSVVDEGVAGDEDRLVELAVDAAGVLDLGGELAHLALAYGRSQSLHSTRPCTAQRRPYVGRHPVGRGSADGR